MATTAIQPTTGIAVRERFDVIVIGAGQAGLSVGYHLAKAGVRFVILDAEKRVGDVWRQRWDSLRLFTPAYLDSLDGMRFPAPSGYFPTKDEMADYLEAYAKKFALPVRSGTRVDRVTRKGDRYLVEAGGALLEADQVIVAMASYQRRRVPAYAKDLSADIVQIHSVDYKNPEQLADGPVLVAGAGNSGAEIAMDVRRRGLPTVVAGRSTGEVPFRIASFFGRIVARLLMRIVFHRVLTIRTPMGRKARIKSHSQGGPLIRQKTADLLAAGIERAPRVVGVKDGRPLLEDGSAPDVKSVVWCTGFHPSHGFIDLPIFDDEGHPRHDGGVVEGEPGLFFVGLHFLYAFSSTMVHGVGRDAERIVRTAVSRLRAIERAPRSAPASARVVIG